MSLLRGVGAPKQPMDNNLSSVVVVCRRCPSDDSEVLLYLSIAGFVGRD